MRIRMTNPNISSYEIEKISGRQNIGIWLENRGIVNWKYDFERLTFEATVPDNFDISQLETWGTVEIIPEVIYYGS